MNGSSGSLPDQTRVWSWYKGGIADLLVFEHAEEVNGKVSAAMQNQTVCSEDSTVDITGCQPLEVHAGRSGRITNRSGGMESSMPAAYACPLPSNYVDLHTCHHFYHFQSPTNINLITHSGPRSAPWHNHPALRNP